MKERDREEEMKESERIVEITTSPPPRPPPPPPPPPPLQEQQALPSCKSISVGRPGDKSASPNHPQDACMHECYSKNTWECFRIYSD